MRPLHINDPIPKVSPSSTSHSLHGLDRVQPGNTPLLRELAYLIGNVDNPPIFKFGKLHKVFENVFNFKGGWNILVLVALVLIFIYLAWFIWLLDPWKAYLICLYRIFLGDVIHGGTKALWISMGVWNPTGWMLRLTCWRDCMMRIAHLMKYLTHERGLGWWD